MANLSDNEKAARARLKLILEALENFDFKNDTLVSYRKTGVNWTAVFDLVGIKQVKISFHYSSHEESCLDPRGFGDTPAVVAAAMRDWTPNSSTTVSKSILTIEAMGDTISLDIGSVTYVIEMASTVADKIRRRIEELVNQLHYRQDEELDASELSSVEEANAAARAARHRK